MYKRATHLERVGRWRPLGGSGDNIESCAGSDSVTRDYLAALRERVLIYDGATGTSVQARELTADDFGGKRLEGCNEALVLSRPDVVDDIHRSFFEVGADVVETDTFGGSRPKLDEYGLGDQTYEINRLAAAARSRRPPTARPPAVAVTASWPARSGRPASCPRPPTRRSRTSPSSELVDIFEEQGRALVDGGADVLLVETGQDILEVRAAVAGIRRAFDERHAPRPDPGPDLARHLGPDAARHRGRRRAIVDPGARRAPTSSASTARPAPTTCACRSATLAELARRAALGASRTPASRSTPKARRSTRSNRSRWPSSFAQFVDEYGVAAVGGCCGTTPEHIATPAARQSMAPPARTS